MSRVLFTFLARRHALTCGLCSLLPMVIGAMIGFVYPSYAMERDVLLPLIKRMPLSKIVFRSDLDIVDIFSPSGAFNIPFQHALTQLAFAVSAAIPAIGLPAAERGTGTLHLMLSTRLTRKSLVLTTALFLVPVAAVMGFAPFVGSLIGASGAGVSGQLPLGTYAWTAAHGAALTLFLGAVGLLVSVCSRDRTAATVRYVALMAVFWLVDVASRLWKNQDWISKLTPLGYYNPGVNLGERSHSLFDLSVLLGGAALSVASAMFLEDRRRSV
jgi:hypothetical protein